MVAVGKQTALDQPGLLSALPYGGSVSGTPPYLPPSTRDQEQLLAAAPRSIARDLTLLLTILTTKAQSGALSPAGFVTALRYLRDFEKKPFENFSALTSTLRGVPLIGPLILKDPRSPEARGLASAAAFSALSGYEKGALASQAIVDAGMRLLTFFKDQGLLELPVSREKVRSTLQPPLNKALSDYVQRYGSDPRINKLLEAGGQRGNLKSNPPRTPLQTLLVDYR